jgi:hypothetical protein
MNLADVIVGVVFLAVVGYVIYVKRFKNKK